MRRYSVRTMYQDFLGLLLTHKALDLKEGDEIEISIAGKRDFKVARDRSKERALEQLRQMKWSFPPDFKFNREELNER